jgi:hypothetical protein
VNRLVDAVHSISDYVLLESLFDCLHSCASCYNRRDHSCVVLILIQDPSSERNQKIL